MQKHYKKTKRFLRAMFPLFIITSLLCAPSSELAAQVNLEWVKAVGGDGNDYGRGVAVDREGNVWVAGYFSTPTDFDPGSGVAILESSNVLSDGFIAKYDAQGNYLWAKRIGGTGIDNAYHVAVDSIGNGYVTGHMQSAAAFDTRGRLSDTLKANGGADAFLAKYDRDGNLLWANRMGSGGSDQGLRVTADAVGNVCVVGYFGTTGDFNPANRADTLNPYGRKDVFVAKYDPDGKYLWARNIGGGTVARGAEGHGVAIDRQGNVLVSGFFTGTAFFDPGVSITGSPGQNAFLARYSAEGKYLWAVNTEGVSGMGGGISSSSAVTVDQDGNAYVTGEFGGAVDFDVAGNGAILTTPGAQNGFIGKYDSNGKYIWAITLGTGGACLPYGIDIDRASNVYVTGAFGGYADFDPRDTVAAFLFGPGSWNMFAGKYTSDGAYQWAKNVGDAGTSTWGRGVAADRSGNLHFTGYFDNSVDFDPEAGTVFLTSKGGTDVFILKLICQDTFFSSLTVAECLDSYTLNGAVYTASGLYTQRFANTTGCDSIIELHLSLYPFNEPFIAIDELKLSVTHVYTAYQWIKNGTDIPGATDSIYNVTENGDYQVRVVGENNCEGTSPVYTISNVPTSIAHSNNSDHNIDIYPNPTNETLFLHSDIDVDVTLLNIEGRKLLEEKDARAISMKGWINGIYILHVKDKEGRFLKVARVVKKE